MNAVDLYINVLACIFIIIKFQGKLSLNIEYTY